MTIDINIGDYKVVKTGVLICLEDNVFFNIDGIQISIKFQKDDTVSGYKQEFERIGEVNSLHFINYDNHHSSIGLPTMWNLGNGYYFNYRVEGSRNGTIGRLLYFNVYFKKTTN